MYPIEPTKWKQCHYQPEWFETDFMHSPDGIKKWPQHHCKLTWLESKPHIKSWRRAIDIGCRDGEYTRYLQHYFEHVYCFDPRLRPMFAYNVDLNKCTHWAVPVGDGEANLRINHKNPGIKRKFEGGDARFYRIDDFNLTDIDYIKIDTDGFERAVIRGALNTIQTSWPLLVIEQDFEVETLAYVTGELGYTLVGKDPRGWDHILIKLDK